MKSKQTEFSHQLPFDRGSRGLRGPSAVKQPCKTRAGPGLKRRLCPDKGGPDQGPDCEEAPLPRGQALHVFIQCSPCNAEAEGRRGIRLDNSCGLMQESHTAAELGEHSTSPCSRASNRNGEEWETARELHPPGLRVLRAVTAGTCCPNSQSRALPPTRQNEVGAGPVTPSIFLAFAQAQPSSSSPPASCFQDVPSADALLSFLLS